MTIKYSTSDLQRFQISINDSPIYPTPSQDLPIASLLFSVQQHSTNEWNEFLLVTQIPYLLKTLLFVPKFNSSPDSNKTLNNSWEYSSWFDSDSWAADPSSWGSPPRTDTDKWPPASAALTPFSSSSPPRSSRGAVAKSPCPTAGHISGTSSPPVSGIRHSDIVGVNLEWEISIRVYLKGE